MSKWLEEEEQQENTTAFVEARLRGLKIRGEMARVIGNCDLMITGYRRKPNFKLNTSDSTAAAPKTFAYAHAGAIRGMIAQ